MLDRIEAGQRAQRAFTSDAAHELRTPLMALQGEIELARREPDDPDPELLARLDSLTSRLGRRVDDLVLLSTLDEGRPLVSTAVDVTALVRDELDAASLGTRAVLVGGTHHVEGDADLLARALRNLVANAARHARDQVRVEVERVGDRVVVSVDDDGPGIPPDATATVFERFTRLDPARAVDRGGSGLGLSIVRSVAHAHGGDVAAGASPMGGARLVLSLPAA